MRKRATFFTMRVALASVHLDFVSFVFTEDALLSLIRAAISIWGTEEQKE